VIWRLIVHFPEGDPVYGTATNTNDSTMKKHVTGTNIKLKTSPRNGKWKEFNKYAVLISEGNYVNNEKHGLWREYYDTGELMIEECYKHGVPHGRYASYHQNGQLMSEGQYHEGLREGYFKVYDEQGRNIRTLLFIHNNQIEDIEQNYASEIQGNTSS
jgi:antitoxin component YwqK of YwqJK toxin-antitoxin module